MANPKIIHAVGRRKSSVARVYIRKGKGEFIINRRSPDEYFDTTVAIDRIYKPLELVKQKGLFDIKVNVKGGGKTGQSGAISLGLARALLLNDEELRPIFRGAGLLTRDSRRVERKKYGQKGARKKFQFSKR